MALILVDFLQQSDDNKNCSFYDGTGLGSSSNPTGYSYGGNPGIVNFGNCDADWYFPDSTTKLPATTIGATINMYPTLPNTSLLPFLTTSVALFGSDQVFPNGIYRVVRRQSTTVDPPTEFSSDTKFPIIGQVRCCIKNLVLVAESCTCHGKNNYDLLKANMFLDQLYEKDRADGDISDAEECNFWNRAAEIIIEAEAICANANCDTCRSAKCC